MSLRNRKAILGGIMVFIVALGVTIVALIMTNRLVGEEQRTEIVFLEDRYVASAIASAIVNSPKCLLYTTPVELADGTKTFASKRNLIKSGWAAGEMDSCVVKLPYIWEAYVFGEERFRSGDITGCTRIAGKTLQIEQVGVLGGSTTVTGGGVVGVIETGEGSITATTISVDIYKKDMELVVSKRGNIFTIATLNTGTCNSEYEYWVSMVDSNDMVDEAFMDTNNIKLVRGSDSLNILEYTTPLINAEDQEASEITLSNPNRVSLSGYKLKVVANPLGMDSYEKTAYADL